MAYRRIAVLAALALPAVVQAAPPAVVTDSSVFIERRDADNGRRLEMADSFDKGDRVVTVLRWQRRQGSGSFTITNPMPRAIAYQASSRSDELVSVDGGRTWGHLGQLRIGDRLASPEDVTHVRWRIPTRIAAVGRGQIAYSGIVR
ncbi:MAG: hypothetical protein KDE25_05115 [Novosphingobium sp.]|nr:hypothetical protein [Novosphingobium sp.]